MRARFAPVLLVLVAAAFAAGAQPVLVVKPLAETKVAELPAGPLYWRVEEFASVDQARAAARRTALAAESGGKAWLLTLGAAGGATPGGSKVAEIGPLARFDAGQYLLRINEASGAPGSSTSVHSHPGSEAFYVTRGEQSIRTPDGTIRVRAGQPDAGPGGGTPLQVSSTGDTDLHALVLFIVDAGKPFSTPATLP